MATLVEYLGQYDFPENPKLSPIGYLMPNPDVSLRELLPSYHVISYLGVNIPSKDIAVNRNPGLKLSFVSDGLGLNGTIEMLMSHPLFLSSFHEPFSSKRKKEIIDCMKSSLKLGALMRSEDVPSILGLPTQDLESRFDSYKLIFDIFGSSIARDEFYNLSRNRITKGDSSSHSILDLSIRFSG